MPKPRSVLGRLLAAIAVALLVMVSVGVALLLCEAAARLLDDQPLTSLSLPPAAYKPRPPRRLASEAARAALPADVDPGWIDVPPPPLENRGPVDPAMVAVQRAAEPLGVKGFEAVRIWNRRTVEQLGCRPDSVLQRLPQPLLVFSPREDNAFPPYRYPPSRTLPGGLVTNRFGWRGPEISLDKPAGTIRFAFVGASTTVGWFGMPFSYPEYVVHWFNVWAEANHLAVRFDGINAGREGITSSAIAAIVRQEVLPAEPDLVVYYEGANQSLCARRARPAPPSPPRSRVFDLVDRVVAAAARRSALVLRLEAAALRLKAHGGYEPPKPPPSLLWSTELDENDPDIHRPSLPLELQTILADLESARIPLEAAGGELAISSFIWLVSEGLWLDPARFGFIYRSLNEQCWPYRYSDIRRWVDLHNRVMERYAAEHGLPFLGIAGDFPPNPDLFLDGFHLNADGTRLHAWLVFRALLPIVRSRIDSRAWPRPDREPQSVHLAITPGLPYEFSCPAKPH